MIWNYYHFKRWNTKFTRNEDMSKNSYLFKNDEKKKVMYLDNYKHLLKQVAKKLFQNSFIWKSFFWQKGHAILFYSNHVGSLYPICTQLQNVGWTVNLNKHYPIENVKWTMNWQEVNIHQYNLPCLGQISKHRWHFKLWSFLPQLGWMVELKNICLQLQI